MSLIKVNMENKAASVLLINKCFILKIKGTSSSSVAARTLNQLLK